MAQSYFNRLRRTVEWLGEGDININYVGRSWEVTVVLGNSDNENATTASGLDTDFNKACREALENLA